MQVNTIVQLVSSCEGSSESDSSGSSCGPGDGYKLCFESSRPTIDRFMQGKSRLLQAQEVVARLEAEKDSLECQVSDLRQLLKRVAEENVAHKKAERRVYLALQSKVNTLLSTLSFAEQNCLHMETTAAFWAEWCA